MRNKILTILIVNVLFLGAWLRPAFALVHTQEDGLFKLDIPKQWHWVENSQEVIVTYSDEKTVAIEIEFAPSINLSDAAVKKTLKQATDNMINEGIKVHNGVLIDNKEINLDGVYARQLDFKTSIQKPIYVRYITFFNKGYAFTITYGTADDKMRSMLEDLVATFKFK